MDATLQFRIGDQDTEVLFTDTLAGQFEGFFRSPEHCASILVCDDNTRTSCGGFESLILPSGEEHKRWESVAAILRTAMERELARDGLFIALGGGVVCDMTALASSLYMRGSGLVLIPSTLLAMVDASVGGKTGIDFGDVKNLVGTFYPASRVIIAPELLRSLPEEHYRSGLAEVLKHALLCPDKLLPFMETTRVGVLKRDPKVLTEMIRLSLIVKGTYIERDPFEKNLRRHLNLGHTFGHALEAATGFSRCSHGDAVAWGIRMAMRAGKLTGFTERIWVERVNSLLDDYGFDAALADKQPEVDAETLISIMERDKKKKDGRVRFVLQRDAGDTFTTPLDKAMLLRVLTNES